MAHRFVYNKDTAVVKTTAGMVRGYLYDDIAVFKGIPYARAKRFHMPEETEPWEGVMDATSYGYVCPLLDMPRPAGELNVPHRYWVMDEDCLNLNVWTPACDDGRRPVLVWLHGGGYSSGSAIEHIAYEGENMCRIGQTVVVSVNHRLNILGYFDLSDFGEEYANSGNAGTEDIIAALRWIRENISKFGGDPENVTLFGQSGGGGKITTLMQTPSADGLFAKGMIMSGVLGPAMSDGIGSGKKLAEAMMKKLGLKTVQELEEVPFYFLSEAYRQVCPDLAAAGEYTGCLPHPNAFYAGDPLRVGFRRENAGIPLMIGSVFGEFTSFAPLPFDRNGLTEEEGEKIVADMIGISQAKKILPLFKKAYPARNPADLILLDFLFRAPAMEYIAKRSEQNACTYSYLFDQDMPVENGKTPWHCADIPFFFHNTEYAPYAQQEGMTERLEKEMFESLMAFARAGDPNHDGIPEWPACRPGEEYTMIFGPQSHVRCNHDKELIPAAGRYVEKAFAEMMRRNRDKIQH